MEIRKITRAPAWKIIERGEKVAGNYSATNSDTVRLVYFCFILLIKRQEKLDLGQSKVKLIHF